MPGFLANCSWEVAPADCHVDSGIPCANILPGRPKCHGGMAYHGTEELPTDFDDWRHLVQSTVQMAVTKFGLAEVQQCECPKPSLPLKAEPLRLAETKPGVLPGRFEVWNELWGMAGDLPGHTSPACTSEPCIGSVYMALYNASAVGVKAVDQSLKVGGPATEHLNVQHFVEQAKEMKAPVDFVSSHSELQPPPPRALSLISILKAQQQRD